MSSPLVRGSTCLDVVSRLLRCVFTRLNFCSRRVKSLSWGCFVGVIKKCCIFAEKVSILTDKVLILTEKVSILADKVLILTEKVSILADKVLILTEKVSILADKVLILTEKVLMLKK